MFYASWPQEPFPESRYNTYTETGDCHDLSQYSGALVRRQESKSGRMSTTATAARIQEPMVKG